MPESPDVASSRDRVSECPSAHLKLEQPEGNVIFRISHFTAKLIFLPMFVSSIFTISGRLNIVRAEPSRIDKAKRLVDLGFQKDEFKKDPPSLSLSLSLFARLDIKRASWTRDGIALSSFVVADVGGDESSGPKEQAGCAKDPTDIFPPVSQAPVGSYGMAFSKYAANPGRDLRDLPNDLGIFTTGDRERGRGRGGRDVTRTYSASVRQAQASRLSVHVMQSQIRENGNFTLRRVRKVMARVLFVSYVSSAFSVFYL